MERDELTSVVIGAAIAVHRELGPGLLESVYVRCLQIELAAQGVSVRRAVHVPVRYRGQVIEHSYRVDLLVEESLIVEVKSTTKHDPVFEAQLLTYLKLLKLKKGLLLNFGRPVLREGIRRFAL